MKSLSVNVNLNFNLSMKTYKNINESYMILEKGPFFDDILKLVKWIWMKSHSIWLRNIFSWLKSHSNWLKKENFSVILSQFDWTKIIWLTFLIQMTENKGFQISPPIWTFYPTILFDYFRRHSKNWKVKFSNLTVNSMDQSGLCFRTNIIRQ